ncbi:MAG: ATP-binding cassette domain-containing protein [Actinomycetota bacterium]
MARLGAAWTALSNAIPAVFLALVIGLAGKMALAGQLSVGQVVTFAGLATFLAIPLSTFAEIGDVWAGGLASAGRIAQILSEPPGVHDHAGDRTLLVGGCAFNDVVQPPLCGLSISVDEGLVAVAAGSSESARVFAGLLARRIDPESGVVTVGGTDVRMLSLDQLRSYLTLEEAGHPWLSGQTLGAAVGLGVAGASEPELIDNLLMAAADELAARPDALNQPLGERGLDLSGGQRQRVAVARALAVRSPLLVLKDPTTALDSVTEQRLIDRLKVARAGEPTVVITTSSAVLAACDRVLFIEQGRLVAQGSHRQLLVSQPGYRELVAPGQVV